MLRCAQHDKHGRRAREGKETRKWKAETGKWGGREERFLTRVRNDGRAAGMRGAGLKRHGVAAGPLFLVGVEELSEACCVDVAEHGCARRQQGWIQEIGVEVVTAGWR